MIQSQSPIKVNNGESITFKTEDADFDLTFNHPNQFIENITNPMTVRSGSSKILTPANDVTSISYNYKCKTCPSSERPCKY